MVIFTMQDHEKKEVDKTSRNEDGTSGTVRNPEVVEDMDCQVVEQQQKIIPVIEISDESEKTLSNPGSDSIKKEIDDNDFFPKIKKEEDPQSDSEIEREIEEEIKNYLKQENVHEESDEIDFSYVKDEKESNQEATHGPQNKCKEIEEKKTSIAPEKDLIEKNKDKSNGGRGQEETGGGDFKGIIKLSTVMFHGGHSLKTDHKRLLCLDCNTRICPICLCNLVTHLKHHMCYEEPASHPCSTCGCVFRTPCALKAHENLHNEIFPLVCPDCGAMYQQTKYFINHSLEHCFHLFQQVRYPCDVCDEVLATKLDLRLHMKKHVATKYICRLCRKSLGTARKEAVSHLRKEHAVRLTAKTLTFGLDVSTYCKICCRSVPHDHFRTHLSTTPSTVLICPCEREFTSPNLFRIHRHSCESLVCLPEHWKKALPQFKHKNSEDAGARKCSKCGKFATCTNNVCELCKENKCRQCNEAIKCDDSTGICSSCSILSLKSICAVCASYFRPKQDQIICSACLEQRSIESDWLGGEQVVNNEVSAFDTCELKYDGYPSDHESYCLRQDFLSKVVSDKLKEPNQKVSEEEVEELNQMTAMIEQCPTKMLSADTKAPSIKCHLCKVEFLQPGNLLYKLLLHVKKNHFNAVLPTMIPANFAHVERDELDLISRLKLEKEHSGHSEEICIEKGIDTPRKRMRLYDPNQHEKKNKVLKESKVIEQKENTPHSAKRAVIIETQSSPPKKDHEFWDEVYEALSVVDNRGAPKDQKERVVENFSGYSFKRQVKKPVRLVEQEVTKQQSLSKKCKTDSDLEIVSPEKSKVKDSVKKSSTLTTTDGPVIVFDKKKKKVTEEIDIELVKVKNKLRKDNELGFLAKTFQDDNKQEPNKRKRKLASKLVFNHVIDVLNEELDPIESIADRNGGSKSDFVCVCGVEFFSKHEFTQHLLTHRVNPNTLQCMECGECFIVLPTLLKHLRAIHKISDAEKYVAENNKCHEGEADGTVKNDGRRCKVCFQVFPTGLELNKHFRIHGMAFLRETQKDNKLT